MDCDLDPIFWMNRYAKNNKVWTGARGEPLFILQNGKPLDRKTLVARLRNMAQKVGHPKYEKVSGISFRREGTRDSCALFFNITIEQDLSKLVD